MTDELECDKCGAELAESNKACVVCNWSTNKIEHRYDPELLKAVDYLLEVRSEIETDTGNPELDGWVRSEIRAGSLRAMLQASAACQRFDSSTWIDQVDVPTAMVVCTDDLVVPTARQRQLANSLHDARIFEIRANHLACVTEPEIFLPALDQALRSTIDG